LKKEVDAAAETAKSIATLSATAATPADTKAKEGKSSEPLVTTTPVQKKDIDSTVTEVTLCFHSLLPSPCSTLYAQGSSLNAAVLYKLRVQLFKLCVQLFSLII
jgi:hypothetical protein